MTGRIRAARAFLTRQAALAQQVADLTAGRDQLARWLRRADARRGAEVADYRRQLAACRRETEALHGATQALQGEVQQERQYGNRLAHRNNAAHQWADRLPPELAAELRALLSPQLPAPKETTHAA